LTDAKGRRRFASGFVVRPGVVATNFHVVQGTERGSAWLVGDNRIYSISGAVALDRQRDLALLAIDITGPTLELDTSAVVVGDVVYAIGNPEGLEGTFSQGIVSSVRLDADTPLIQITAPISPGSSGGPVLNRKGQVIGVAVGTWKEGQNLNFAIPAAHVHELLKKVGAVTQLSIVR
jgi:S1-C subfamily serine protease